MIVRMSIVSTIDKGIRIENAKRLGGILQTAREEVGLTQDDLAGRLGKNQSYVSRYEAGRCYLDLTQFILICHELYVEPGEMLKRLEESGVGFRKEADRGGKKKEGRR